MKELMKKIFNPNKFLGFFLFNLGFGLLIYVFVCQKEYIPIGYLSYGLSTYALILFCVWFYKVCQFSNQFIKSSRLYHVYSKNSFLVTKGTLYSSLFLNLLYGIFELITGMYYKSWWFITIAIYYLLLCFMKISLVQSMRNELSHNLKKEYQKLKSIGIILFLLNVILIGMVILIVRQNKQIRYHGFLIYMVALYDFYLIISAAFKVMKYRKNHNPILTASKCVNLTVAMISMISLEVAMVSQFGSENTSFKLIMTACMGFGICIINSMMSIHMIIKAKAKLKNICVPTPK